MRDPLPHEVYLIDEAREFGNAMLPPTHPDGPRKMQPVPVLCSGLNSCGHPVDDHTGHNSPRQACPCCSWRKNVPAEPNVTAHRRDLPTPPPDGLDVDPVKWNAMRRPERRALLRQHRAARR
jgi:hypothetical protein